MERRDEEVAVLDPHVDAVAHCDDAALVHCARSLRRSRLVHERRTLRIHSARERKLVLRVLRIVRPSVATNASECIGKSDSNAHLGPVAKAERELFQEAVERLFDRLDWRRRLCGNETEPHDMHGSALSMRAVMCAVRE